MFAGLSPLPSPSIGIAPSAAKAPALSTLPVETPQKPAAPPLPMAPLPAATAVTSPFQAVPSDTVVQAQSIPSETPPESDFTDAELIEAFSPIMEHAIRGTVQARDFGIDTILEPMLRATVRRALAEYSPGSRPFHAPGVFDRFVWHLQALFTSRTYEDILFEKTHRFQVGEVFLVDSATLALVSFASCDPARHASPKRIENAVHRLALQLRDESGRIRESFELPDQRNVLTRVGQFVTLMAVVRGRPSELVIADLEYALLRIEERFRDQFLDHGSPLLHALQPFLEDCLLIQAPASAA